MIMPNHSNIKCCEASIFYIEALAVVHRRCFEISWSDKDLYDLLTLPAVFGFVASVANSKSKSRVYPQTTVTNISRIDFGGFILCSAASDQCEILTICVLPEWRCKGVAKNLIQNVIEKAKNTGVKEIFLEVAENNKIARNLYLGLGFKEFGRREGYYKQKEGRVDAVQLSKIIFG